MNEKFFQSKQAVIVLVAASLVVLVSMGIRQTWGLFYNFFETDLGFSREQFGLAIGIQMVFFGDHLLLSLDYLPINMELIESLFLHLYFIYLVFIGFYKNQKPYLVFK